MHACILAGGFATRLWPLTEKRAKPLLRIDGQSILSRIIDTIPPEVPITILTNAAFARDMQDEVRDLARPRITIYTEPSTQDNEKLGALRSLSLCLQELGIDDDIAIMAGDNILTPFDFRWLDCQPSTATVLLRDIHDVQAARSFGVARVDGGRVTEFTEKPVQPTSTLVSTGFMSLGRDLLPYLHTYSQKYPDNFGRIVTYLLTKNIAIHQVTCNGEWFDIGSFSAYMQAHKTLSTTNVSTTNGNVIDGKVWVGEGSVVRNCVLKDCLIYPHTRLENCTVNGSIIDQNCDLRGVDINAKLIRAGTKLMAD